MSLSCKVSSGMRMLVVLLAGCGGPTYEYADVQGKVTLNGKPLAGAIVKFYPVNESTQQPPIATGITDDSGLYRLQIDENQPGALVGPSIAVVRWPVRDRAVPLRVPQPPIPTKYSVVTESPLKVEIKAGGLQTIDIPMQTD